MDAALFASCCRSVHPRRWSPEEDERLRASVDKHHGVSNGKGSCSPWLYRWLCIAFDLGLSNLCVCVFNSCRHMITLEDLDCLL